MDGDGRHQEGLHGKSNTHRPAIPYPKKELGVLSSCIRYTGSGKSL
jgi:hypothetical protein